MTAHTIAQQSPDTASRIRALFFSLQVDRSELDVRGFSVSPGSLHTESCKNKHHRA